MLLTIAQTYERFMELNPETYPQNLIGALAMTYIRGFGSGALNEEQEAHAVRSYERINTII